MSPTATPTHRAPDHRREARIETPERFCFDHRHEFRRECLSAGPDSCFLLDLARTKEIDTAALGMLLQLEERAGSDPRRLRIINAGDALRGLLELAGLSAYLTRA